MTGQARWHVDSFVVQDTLPLITATDVYVLEYGAATDNPATRIADRDAADGTLRWARVLGDQTFGPQPVLDVGSLAIVQTSSGQPDEPAPLLAFHAGSGQPAWRAASPTLVATAPALVPGGLLIQAADPSYACPAAQS